MASRESVKCPLATAIAQREARERKTYHEDNFALE